VSDHTASALQPTGSPSGSAAATSDHKGHAGLALAVISVAQLMVVLDATIVNIALPSIQTALHFSRANLEWVINAYALAFGGLLLLGGRSGDLFGRRRMFIVGLGLFSVASLLGGFATNEAWLITARAAQGIGGAIASPTALSLIATNFAEGRARNRAMGVYAAMSGAGASVGLLLGGILTDVASWRWVLFVNVPIGLAAAALTPLVLKESTTKRGRLDVPGAVSVTAGMALLVYGLSHAASTQHNGWGSAGTVVPLVASVVLLATFVLIESKSAHALMPFHIFANRNRTGAYIIILGIGAAIFAMFFFLTQFVQEVLGYSPLKAGVAFLPTAATISVVAGITSQVVGRVGPRLPLTIGPLVGAGGLFWLSHVTVHSSYPSVLGPMLLIAVGMGLSFVPLTLVAVSGVRPNEAGLASALLNTGQQIGGSLGLAVLVTVSTAAFNRKFNSLMGALTGPDRAAGAAGHAPPHAVLIQALTAGYREAFFVGSIIALGTFFVALLMVRIRASDIAGVSPMAVG
jgi:EmrB/QacA subfamily drug resistance transporter